MAYENILEQFEDSLEAYRRGASLARKGRLDKAEASFREALSRFPREVLMETRPELAAMQASFDALYGNIKNDLMQIEEGRKTSALDPEYESLQTIAEANAPDQNFEDDDDFDLDGIEAPESEDGPADFAPAAEEADESDLDDLDADEDLQLDELEGEEAEVLMDMADEADISALDGVEGAGDDLSDLNTEIEAPGAEVKSEIGEVSEDDLDVELDELDGDAEDGVKNATLHEMHEIGADAPAVEAPEDDLADFGMDAGESAVETEEAGGEEDGIEEFSGDLSSELEKMAMDGLGGGRSEALEEEEDGKAVDLEESPVGEEELEAEAPDLDDLEEEEIEEPDSSLGLRVESDEEGEGDEEDDEEKEGSFDESEAEDPSMSDEEMMDENDAEEEAMSEEEMRAMSGQDEEEEAMSPEEMAAMSGGGDGDEESTEEEAMEEPSVEGEAPHGRGGRRKIALPLFGSGKKGGKKKKPLKKKGKKAAAAPQLGGFIVLLAVLCAAGALYKAAEGLMAYQELGAPFQAAAAAVDAEDPLAAGAEVLKLAGPGAGGLGVREAGRDLYSDLIVAADKNPAKELALWERLPASNEFELLDANVRKMTLLQQKAVVSLKGKDKDWSGALETLKVAEAALENGAAPQGFEASFRGAFDQMAYPVYVHSAKEIAESDVYEAWKSVLRLQAFDGLKGEKGAEVDALAAQVAGRLAAAGAEKLKNGDAAGAAGDLEKALELKTNLPGASKVLAKAREALNAQANEASGKL